MGGLKPPPAPPVPTPMKRGSLHAPYAIKPDMTPKQRETEAMLLGERWKLILDGTPRNDIKIKNQSLYVNGKLHARVVNSKLQHQVALRSMDAVQSGGPAATLLVLDNSGSVPSGVTSATSTQAESSQVNATALPSC